MVVSLTNAVNHPIKLTRTICRRRELAFEGQRRWFSRSLHSLRTPRRTHLALGYPKASLMTPGMLATLVLDGARRYTLTLVGTAPEAPPPLRAETPAAERDELAGLLS